MTRSRGEQFETDDSGVGFTGSNRRRSVGGPSAGHAKEGVAEQVVDAIYSKFLLRDLCGKIVPGVILLSALAIAAFGEDWLRGRVEAVFGSEGIELGSAILLFGIAWVLGFVPQALGVLILDDGFFWSRDDGKVWRRHHGGMAYKTRRRAFLATASPSSCHLLERYTAIREAVGNTALALLIAPLIALWGRPELYSSTLIYRGLPIVGGVATALALMHRAHVRRQWEYVHEETPPDTADGGTHTHAEIG